MTLSDSPAVENGRRPTRLRCWVVLGVDGRHVLLGRNSDPSPEEIAKLDEKLAATHQAGWLAILDGDYWAKRKSVDLMMVRPLACPKTSFEDAVASFRCRRNRAIGVAP